MKKYIIFAGVNGAGKSTLFQTNPQFLDMPRINMDEIIREFGSWENGQDVMKAGRIAVQYLREFVGNGISFNQETTLCGRGFLKNIIHIKKCGYYIEMYYVGVDSVEIAKERVKKRVLAGGHGIPEQDIERRYWESLNQLKHILPLCDVAELYDNTEYFAKVAEFENGICTQHIVKMPKWTNGIM